VFPSSLQIFSFSENEQYKTTGYLWEEDLDWRFKKPDVLMFNPH